MDTLYFAWVIGAKDILDALKNKNSRNNIIIMVVMVVFFYWFGALRPFDKNASVIVYDEGNANLALETVTLDDGAKYSFREALHSKKWNRKWPTKTWAWCSLRISTRNGHLVAH